MEAESEIVKEDEGGRGRGRLNELNRLRFKMRFSYRVESPATVKDPHCPVAPVSPPGTSERAVIR